MIGSQGELEDRGANIAFSQRFKWTSFKQTSRVKLATWHYFQHLHLSLHKSQCGRLEQQRASVCIRSNSDSVNASVITWSAHRHVPCDVTARSCAGCVGWCWWASWSCWAAPATSSSRTTRAAVAGTPPSDSTPTQSCLSAASRGSPVGPPTFPLLNCDGVNSAYAAVACAERRIQAGSPVPWKRKWRPRWLTRQLRRRSRRCCSLTAAACLKSTKNQWRMMKSTRNFIYKWCTVPVLICASSGSCLSGILLTVVGNTPS